MTTEHALRDYARGKFQELYPGKSIKPRNAELAVYNWAVTHTANNISTVKNKREVEEPSWENRLFRWRYKQRLLSVLLLLLIRRRRVASALRDVQLSNKRDVTCASAARAKTK